jgi:hypothetical protein
MLLPFLSQSGAAAANAAGTATDPAADANTQQANRLTEMMRLLGGDLSGSLSGGDKLLALSGLLRSATRSGRRAGLTPQQVIGDLQKQKLAELQSRLTIEQTRAQMAQRQQQLAETVEWSKSLPEAQRKAFLGQPLEKRLERMDAEAFRREQLFTRERDPATGLFRNVYQSGKTELTDVEAPANTEWLAQDVGGRQEMVLYDKDTNQPVVNKDGKFITRFEGVPEGERQRIDIGRGNLAVNQARLGLARAGGGGGGGGGGAQTQIKSYFKPDGTVTQGEVRWNKGKDSWVDRSGNPVRLAPSQTPGFPFAVPQSTGIRRFP